MKDRTAHELIVPISFEALYPRNHFEERAVLAAVKQINPAVNPKFGLADDLASGHLFATVYKSVLRYNVTAKSWYAYDSDTGRWLCDEGGMTAGKHADLLVRALQEYAIHLDGRYAPYKNYCHTLGKHTKRQSMLEDAKAYMKICADDLDANPNYFNVLNCVIDLSTGETMSHDPEFLFSKVANVSYDPSADSSFILKFLNDIMSDDQEKLGYLQRVSGYALTGDCPQEEFYIFYGPSTRNGKSSFCDTLEHMCGDYAAHIQPQTLAQKDSSDSRAASGDIARLKGIRYLHCSEPPKKMKFDVALIKTFTGRDPITARFLYAAEFEFIPVFKLIINTNYLPVVLDDTLFSSERVKVITFDRHFSPEEQDPNLKDRLKESENLSALLNWCLDGLKQYHNNHNRLMEPACVKQATAEYRKASDKIANFIEETMIQDLPGTKPASVVSGKDAYDVFVTWCKDNGFGIDNKSNFYAELRTKNLLKAYGTIRGVTVKNVIPGYQIDPDAYSLNTVFGGTSA